MKPEPATELEIACMQGISDVDFEVFRHKMQMITLECKETCIKLGASTGMRWGDLGISIYTASGDSAICATGIWFHTVLGQIPLKYILRHWAGDPSVGIREGDSFFANDPLYGGVHTPDMMQYMPVFNGEELVAWVGCVVHSGETGATEPGGAPLTSRSRYDEGIHIPPIKIAENFRLREDVINTFAHMVRDPRSLILDIKARAAACAVGRKRILEVIAKKGVHFFVGALRKLISSTSEAAKRKVSLLHDGVYRQPRMLDTVGVEDALIKLMVTIRKEGEKLHLDMEDTSPEIPDKPVNSHFQGIIGISAIFLCGYLFHDLPANSGLLEVLEWHFPEHTVVNPNPESPTCLSPWTQVIVEHGISQIGSKMMYSLDPKRSVAAWFRGFNMAYYGGVNQYGEPLADVGPEMNAGGLGARPDMDGVNVAGAYFAAMSDTGDVESIEMDRPFIYPYRKFFKDSFGFGRFRGGAGLDYAMMIHNVPWLFIGGIGYGAKIPATIGLFGGYAIPTIVAIKQKQSGLKDMYARSDKEIPFSTQELLDNNNLGGNREVWPISCPGEVLMEGDVFVAAVGGGAGYGDVLERDPEQVVLDVKDGLSSTWAAENIYHVVYDPETFRVDVEATEHSRARERQRRLEQSLDYDEFERQWLAKRPPDHVLKYYGNWPHPSKGVPGGVSS
jgi:acetophenone carboxylase